MKITNHITTSQLCGMVGLALCQMVRTAFDQGLELGVSRIRDAITMEERCKAIEMLGRKLYENW